MQPVISMDATHLKSKYKGCLYTYSGLTANNETYIYTFGAAHENECYETRKFMNEQFSAAIPGIADETLVDMSGMPMQPSFISDQNKGIAQALDRVFPHIDANHCAQHIKMNVGRKFGKELARTYLSLGACQVLGIDCTHLQYCWQA